MMTQKDFRKYAHEVADRICDYLENVESYPVKPVVTPGSIRNQVANHAPLAGENFESILHDVQQIILPNLTHWQHPGFMALFPSDASFESMLAEFFIAGFGVNCMTWDTSPAATELEESVLQWLQEICGLPASWKGVIHDTASVSTLCAILSAREKISNYKINEDGFSGFEDLILYCTSQTHYSIAKGAKIAGFGMKNIRLVETDENFAMRSDKLEEVIKKDSTENKIPAIVVATLGTTSSLGFDPLAQIAEITTKYNIWLHVDAAYAGSAFILPEYKSLLNGIQQADSYVFNPHKWLFTNFDCSTYYVKDPDHLKNVFSSNPDYLKTSREEVTNYKDWGIPLGRRFRSLKLWFVLRSFGVEGLQKKIRDHIRIAEVLADMLTATPDWEMMAPFRINVLCGRFHPAEIPDENIDAFNEHIIQEINASGNFYLTGTKLNGRYAIRIVPAQTHVTEQHVITLYHELTAIAEKKKAAFSGSL